MLQNNEQKPLYKKYSAIKNLKAPKTKASKYIKQRRKEKQIYKHNGRF